MGAKVRALLAGFAPAWRLGQQALRTGRLNNGGDYREDRILIIRRPDAAAVLNRLHGQWGARVRKSFPNLGDIQVLGWPVGVSPLDMVRRYRQSGHVEVAELDHPVSRLRTSE